MPPKTINTTEQMLRTIGAPRYGKRYAVVEHGFVIDQTRMCLSAAGFKVTQESYKSSIDGQLAQGVYFIEHGDDPDMKLMFAWSNSYNKLSRFKCSIGAHVIVCGNGMLSGDMNNYKRKHLGQTALQDVADNIKSQISLAQVHYDRLIADKNLFKSVILSSKQKGQILGELFACSETLTLTQVGIVKREMDKPSLSYNADIDSVWTMYNYVTYALKQSHPVHYLDDHQAVHNYFTSYISKLSSEPTVFTKDNSIITEVDAPVAIIEDEKKEETTTDDVFGVNFL